MKRTLSAVALLIATSCRDGVPTGSPEPQQGVTLSITISSKWFRNASAFVFRVEASNNDSVHLYRGEGCSYWKTGLILEFLAPDGSVSYPKGWVRGRCPDWRVDFGPGEHLVATTDFDGTLYDSRGGPAAAISGDYTAVARFDWSTGPAWENFHQLERRVGFRWYATGHKAANKPLQLTVAARNG